MEQNKAENSVSKENAVAEHTENAAVGTKSSKKKKHVAIFVISGLIAVLLIIYGSIALYYRSHFLPNTTINGLDSSNLDASEVAVLLENQAQGYLLEVSGRVNEDGEKGVLGEIRAQDIQLTLVDTLNAVQDLLAQQNYLLWIGMLMNKSYSNSLVQEVAFDEEMLEACIRSWDACQNKNMIAPQDAYIGEYSQENQCYEIIPETLGTRLDMQAVISETENAIITHASQIDLEELGCYKSAKVTADDKTLVKNLNTVNQWLETSVTYDWNGSEIVVDRERIREWITIDKNTPKLDEEAVAQFVSDTAKELDTYGKKRQFTTTLGVELTLPSGAYGWKTDREGETEELIQLIYQGSSLSKEPLYISKGANKGSNDIGSSYVEADLSNQHLYLYQNGTLVLETDFVSGNMSKSGCMTPPGVFGLTYKTTNAVLRGDDYETPVNYWMPFNGNVGMHDATWRYHFGGDIYLTNGSHGCINLPLNMAAEIYQYVSTGFPVICYYY